MDIKLITEFPIQNQTPHFVKKFREIENLIGMQTPKDAHFLPDKVHYLNIPE